MKPEIVHTDAAPAAIGPYSQAVLAGGFLFTAGQIALDPATQAMVPGDVAAQTRRVFLNLKAILAAGGLSFDDVVKATVFLTTMEHFAAMNEVYAQHLGAVKPARSTVAVSGLPKGALVEIELIAKAPK
jgi:2-iminobutanoate/2-iminopropanoate deaminase